MAEIRTVELIFAAAGEQAAIVGGELIHVIDASAPVYVQPDGVGAWIELEKALGIRVREGFAAIRVKSDFAQTVRLMVGSGDVIDARTVLTGGAAVQVAGGDTIEHGEVAVDDVAGEVVPASLSRVSVLIQCYVGQVFIGKDASVTVNNGVKLEAGQSIKITAKAAVWAVALYPGQSVRFLEEVN